jgi:hypothetical protein
VTAVRAPRPPPRVVRKESKVDVGADYLFDPIG